MTTHENYINRCIQLAKNGFGTTYPNPMVGSVIVYKNKIIGEGWHRKAGEPHAEVNAIRSVKNTELLSKSIIYVSLEPCSHFGKTPPCSNLIIASGIKKVVIGTVDPFAKVAGNGIKKLLDAGCEVIVGVLEEACQHLNKRFFTFHNKKRPYIILKWAMTINSCISPDPKTRNSKKPVWITGSASRQLVHKWRSEEQAILIGSTTALEDNPSLTTRDWHGANPIRILIDRNAKTPISYTILDCQVKTLVFISKKTPPPQGAINIEYHQLDFETNILTQLLEVLYTYQIQSIIVEGGTFTLQQFIDSNLWDEARVFTGTSNFINGIEAPTGLQGKTISTINIGTDTLTNYLNA